MHLADLHLGKIFHDVHLTDDQAHILDQIVEMAIEGRVEVVAISGDVYDRSVPPVQATVVMDDFLTRLIDMGIRVVMTPGNHDSPERISFGSRLMRSRGLFIASGLPGKVTPVVIEDARGPVSFYPLPYVEPLLVRKSLEDQDVSDFDSAMARVMAGIQNGNGRSVCLAHCFTNGGESSESERPLSIGGSSLVGTGHFDRFQLTLLGHLHRPQKISDTIFYAGSPLAYSFQESAHVKTVAIYDLAADGSFTRELLPLIPLRRVRTISGVLAEVLAGWDEDPGRDDYLWVELTDRGALFDYASRIRSVYPNVLNITRTAYENDGPTERIDIRGRSETEIVASFFRHVTGEELLQEEAVLMEAVMGEVFAGQQGSTP
jgi:exonuclease SbcD